MLLDIVYPTTSDDFDYWASLPENVSRHFEWIDGKVVEKMVTSPRSSKVGMRLGGFMMVHAEAHQLGDVTGEQGGYHVGDDRYIPDVGFLRREKVSAPIKEGYCTVAPDLVIEVISPSDLASEITTKVTNYLLAGVVVWLVEPITKTLTVYIAGKSPQKLTKNDTLEGGDVLPGFSVALTSVFRD